MADITITRITRDGDTVTAIGSGFTKTTSKFYDQNSSEIPFEVLSDTEARLTVDARVTSIFAVKGELSTEAIDIEEGGEEEGNGEGGPAPTIPGHEENVSTGEEGEDDLADVTGSELEGAASTGGTPPPQPEVEPLEAGEHLPGEDFRARVENTAAGDLDQDPREPYPTGNPPDPRESFHRINGFYPPEESGAPADAQAAQMDANPAT